MNLDVKIEYLLEELLLSWRRSVRSRDRKPGSVHCKAFDDAEDIVILIGSIVKPFQDDGRTHQPSATSSSHVDDLVSYLLF